MTRTIILASSSPRRKALLEQIQLPFTVEVSNFEEYLDQHTSPQQIVQELSLGKAQIVAQKHVNESVIVIGSDTIIMCEGKKLGKPKNKKDAFVMLRFISGKKHTVYTGLTVVDCLTQKAVTTFGASDVYFKKLTDEEIEQYVATGEPMDKAGGYGIQELGSMFVEKIDGDYFTVVGLPLPKLVDILKRFGLSPLDFLANC